MKTNGVGKYREYKYRVMNVIKALKDFESIAEKGEFTMENFNKVKRENTIAENRKFRFGFASSHKWDFDSPISFTGENYFGIVESSLIQDSFVSSDLQNKKESLRWAIFVFPFSKEESMPNTLKTVIYFKHRSKFHSVNQFVKKVDKIMKKFENHKFADKAVDYKIGDKVISKIVL